MIVGRETEIRILDTLLQSRQAEFLAIYGRRRIGKTYLINEFFKNKGCWFEMTGSNKASKKEQLKAFHREFSSVFPQFSPDKSPDEWADALALLLEVGKALPVETKFVLFIDELPWLATPKSGFLAALDYFWNRHFSRMPNVVLIICGSAAHWMIRKVICDKGGLHGRLSAQISLQAFSLAEAENYLLAKGVKMTRKQIIELYMTIGGVAKYLSYASAGTSASQTINEICFSQNGPLVTEFTKLYQSLFNSPEKHIAIVRALARANHGLDQQSLLAAVGLTQSGSTTLLLEELEESGFIAPLKDYGKKTKNRLWRLVDEYSLFYLYWLEPLRGDVLHRQKTDTWLKAVRTAEWYVWAGHAFESACLKHIEGIKRALGISAVKTTESHWQHRGTKGATDAAAEVNLVIDRADDCVHLCEIKFVDAEYEISTACAKALERKRTVFRQQTGTKKAVFITMITPYGITANSHSRELIDQSLTMDALFLE